MQILLKKRGFTLVELLVVITIIGMLMSLLMPAIQSARESGRQATCMNNIKQWSTAMLSYEAGRKGLPGVINELGKARNPEVASLQGKAVCGSWVVSLLPYIERSDIYDMWLEGRHVENSAWKLHERSKLKLNVASCPSNVLGEDAGNLHCVYRVNAGRQGYIYKSEDSTNCGLFDLNFSSAVAEELGMPTNFNRQSLSLDAVRDGTSNTLLLSENAQGDDGNSYGTNLGWATGADLLYSEFHEDDNELGGYRELVERRLGFRIPRNEASEGPKGAEGIEFERGPFNVNLNGRDEDIGGGSRGASPASFHPGLVMVAFADGHIRSLNENIDLETYMHLMTPNGKRAEKAFGRKGKDFPWFGNILTEDSVLNDDNY